MEGSFDRLERLFGEAMDLEGEPLRQFLLAVEDEDPTLAARLERMLQADDSTFLEPKEPLRDRVATGRLTVPGFRIDGVIASGGMGTVYRAFQESARRPVALKTLRAGPFSRSATLRLRREAEILGRLEHPGIARIYDAGVHDDEGLAIPWYAMELIEGLTLDASVRDRALERTGRIALMAEVADAVHAAHEQGIVHRDLKPSNVMVDRDGRPKVLDFGVARVLDDALEITTIATQTGEIIGTVQYMSPEQTLGQPDLIDARTDVYALGLMLYETLVGRKPYELAGLPLDEALRVIRQEDGVPLSRRDSALAGDLEVICGRALEKDPARRYPTAAEFARDLRRHLQDEPITARPPSAVYRLTKFVRRHRIVLTAAGIIIVGLSLGLLMALREKGRADDEAASAKRALGRLSRLSDAKRLTRLIAQDEALWPASPKLAGPMERWLAEANELVDRIPLHRETLARLRGTGTSSTASPESERGKEADRLRRVITERGSATDDERALLLAEHTERTRSKEHPEPLVFEDDLTLSWHIGVLEELVLGLEELEASSRRDRMRERLRYAREIEQITLDAAKGAWRRAIARVADDARFASTALTPQLGLIPLGPDSDSGFEEFLHFASHRGEIPVRDPEGKLLITETTGIVLVLLPGGVTLLGAQAADTAEPRFDPYAEDNESPVHEVSLDPYFIGKYEVTQAQWIQMAGDNPSGYPAGARIKGAPPFTLLHPVEEVSFAEALKVVKRFGLTLPTEAQWEYAARAGTDSVFFTGDDPLSLVGAANLADGSAIEAGARWPSLGKWRGPNDGYAMHAPVNTLRPNAFGLHHVLGNVWEYCLDGWDRYVLPVVPGTGERLATPDSDRIIRGGAYAFHAEALRCANRNSAPKDSPNVVVGLRAARSLDP